MGLVFFLSIWGPAFGQNLLTNGGFENDDGVTFSVDFNGGGAGNAALIPLGPAGGITDVEITGPNPGGYYFSDSTSAQEGENFVWLSDTNHCAVIGLTTLGLVDGEDYEVSVFVSAWDQNMDGSYSPLGAPGLQTDTPFSVELQHIDDTFTVLGAPTAPSTAGGDFDNLNWLQYSYQFTYDDSLPSTDLRNLLITSASGDPNIGIAVDNVTLQAIPEASTALLAVALIIGTALTRRRAS